MKKTIVSRREFLEHLPVGVALFFPSILGARKVTFRLVAGAADSAGVAVAFDFPDWSRNNYVLVPAVVYDGNRFHALGDGYMPPYPRYMFFNPKLPLTISNNPRLSAEPGLLEVMVGASSADIRLKEELQLSR